MWLAEISYGPSRRSTGSNREIIERGDAPGGAPIDPGWYFRKPGGGPLYDMAVYALHGLTSVLGPAKHVTALSGRVVPERTFAGKPVTIEIDDNTVLLLGSMEAPSGWCTARRRVR